MTQTDPDTNELETSDLQGSSKSLESPSELLTITLMWRKVSEPDVTAPLTPTPFLHDGLQPSERCKAGGDGVHETDP